MFSCFQSMTHALNVCYVQIEWFGNGVNRAPIQKYTLRDEHLEFSVQLWIYVNRTIDKREKKKQVQGNERILHANSHFHIQLSSQIYDFVRLFEFWTLKMGKGTSETRKAWEWFSKYSISSCTDEGFFRTPQMLKVETTIDEQIIIIVYREYLHDAPALKPIEHFKVSASCIFPLTEMEFFILYTCSLSTNWITEF